MKQMAGSSIYFPGRGQSGIVCHCDRCKKMSCHDDCYKICGGERTTKQRTKSILKLGWKLFLFYNEPLGSYSIEIYKK